MEKEVINIKLNTLLDKQNEISDNIYTFLYHLSFINNKHFEMNDNVDICGGGIVNVLDINDNNDLVLYDSEETLYTQEYPVIFNYLSFEDKVRVYQTIIGCAY